MAKLSPTINALYRQALPVCDRRGISLNIEQNDPSLSAKVSTNYLRNTLAQILQEAIQRCQKGDQITIGAEQDQDQISMFVRDSGQSLDRAQKSHIQSPSVTVRSRYGYGTSITVTL